MKAPKFKAHYNRELGKRYYTEKDYKKDMKVAGLEPYNPDSVKKRERVPYQRSEWLRGMHEDIKSRSGRPPGDRFIKELEKRGFSQESYEKTRRMANEGHRN